MKTKPCLFSSDRTKKSCAKCHGMFPLSAFHVIRKTGKLRPYCRPCQKAISSEVYEKNKPYYAEINKKARRDPQKAKEQRERGRKWYFKTNYGLTLEKAADLEEMQGKKCAICEVPFAEIPSYQKHIDHDHVDGTIRGVLCHHCNQVIGQARDNVEVLQKAITYLSNHAAFRRKHPEILHYMPRTSFNKNLFSKKDVLS